MQGGRGRNDGVDDCDHEQYPRDHRAVLSRDSLCDINEAPAGQRRTADDGPRGRADVILICILTALSGAVTGFAFAGQFTLTSVACAGLALGVVVGWLARGVVA